MSYYIPKRKYTYINIHRYIHINKHTLMCYLCIHIDIDKHFLKT